MDRVDGIHRRSAFHGSIHRSLLFLALERVQTFVKIAWNVAMIEPQDTDAFGFALENDSHIRCYTLADFWLVMVEFPILKRAVERT